MERESLAQILLYAGYVRLSYTAKKLKGDRLVFEKLIL
jgi:hypothetical protein